MLKARRELEHGVYLNIGFIHQIPNGNNVAFTANSGFCFLSLFLVQRTIIVWEFPGISDLGKL